MPFIQKISFLFARLVGQGCLLIAQGILIGIISYNIGGTTEPLRMGTGQAWFFAVLLYGGGAMVLAAPPFGGLLAAVFFSLMREGIEVREHFKRTMIAFCISVGVALILSAIRRNISPEATMGNTPFPWGFVVMCLPRNSTGDEACLMASGWVYGFLSSIFVLLPIANERQRKTQVLAGAEEDEMEAIQRRVDRE